MTTVTLRMPEDVIDDRKRIAPLLGYSGYQPLIRAYMCINAVSRVARPGRVRIEYLKLLG